MHNKMFASPKVVVVGCAYGHVYAHMHANLGLGKISMYILWLIGNFTLLCRHMYFYYLLLILLVGSILLIAYIYLMLSMM